MTSNGLEISGRIWKFGDNISTDHILPSRFMTQVEPHELASHCMTGYDPEFSSKVRPGDLISAGDNFGYGSSREQAPQALKYAGINAIIAKSFARIFYRNCYNVGILALACTTFVEESSFDDIVEINLSKGLITNRNLSKTYEFSRPPEFILNFIKSGGLIPYLENHYKSSRGPTTIVRKDESQ